MKQLLSTRTHTKTKRIALPIVQMLTIFTLAASFQSAYALPTVDCTGLPGCGVAAGNSFANALIPSIATILLNSAAALSVIFVMVGGARLVLSTGKEEEVPKAQKTIIWALAGLVVAIASHRIVAMVTSEVYVTGGASPLLDLFATAANIISGLLNVTFGLMILMGGLRMIMARGKDDEVSKGRRAILYAVTGVIIINVAPFVVKQILVL